MRTVAVVCNVHAGSGAAEAEPSLDQQITALLAARGIGSTFRAFDPTSVGDDVSALVAEAPDALIVAGGDGTVRSVAAEMIGGTVPLGVLPTGTMNMLATDLGVPTQLESALDAVLGAPTVRIDAARVNGQVFLCAAALAVLPHLGRIRERVRDTRGLPILGLLARGVRMLRRFPRMLLRLEIDGRTHIVRTRAVVVSNNPLSAGPGSAPGRDLLDTGRLAVYVTNDRTQWDLFGIAAKLIDGTWQNSQRIRVLLGHSVRVSTPGLSMMSVMVDGEVIQMDLPLHFAIEPSALIVLAPGDAS